MKTGKSTRGVTIFLHVLAWLLLGFVLILYQPLSWGVKLPMSFWIRQSLNITFFLGLFYFNANYMVPRYLLKNNIPVFVLWTIASITVLLFLSRFIDQELRVWEQLDVLIHRPGPKHKGRIDSFLLMTSLLVLGISTSLSVVQRWQKDAQLRELSEKQHISSELAVLKAQINPHFFFNTLNNIYALTFSDVSVSRDAILKLSRMMRYLLYDTQQDIAPLNLEISFANDYIELMKLRMHAGMHIIFQPPKTDRDYSIAPMLLLPFIENTFKHGTSTLHKADIVIDLHVLDGILTLNTLNTIFHEKNPLTMESGGIGLANTKRRLNLLYPEKHNLSILENKENNTYNVMLTIDLR